MDESDCPTTPKEKQWEQNVTTVDEHSRIDAAANIINPEGESAPGKGCCSGKVAKEEEPVIATSASLESTPPPKPQPPPNSYVEQARRQRALREWNENVLRDRDRALREADRELKATMLRDEIQEDESD